MRLRSSQSLTIQILDRAEYSQWDALVKANSWGCFMQSTAWADFKELEGYQTFRYGLFTRQKLVGGCIIYFYPHVSEAKLLLSPGGPILPEKLLNQGLKLLVDHIERWLAPQLGAIALRIEPLWTHKPQGFSEFVRSPADSITSETLLINLQPTLTEIMAAMKPKGRYNIRLSIRHGVETKFTSDPQVIPLFYEIFHETAQRQQFFSEPYSFFINLCQILFAANSAEIGFAIWQGQVLAAMLVVYWGERATYLYGGRRSTHPEVMPAYGLHWAAMQQAKMRGCKFYDFYGFTRNPNHAYAKFSNFKRQFGGIPTTTIGAQDYIFYERLADTLIEVLRSQTGYVWD